MEAVVGQNVTLPCTVNGSTDLKIVSIEWRKNKNEDTKLVLYSEKFGINRFWPNVTIQIENKSMGSHLHLFRVAKWDSGFYICDITSFPLGTIRSETELEIKDDVKIMCDMDRIVEVYTGENVTIQCRAVPDAQYKWTKNKILVSENTSLELWCVTEAHTGVYTLTVNTGNKSLHQEFIITVLTATTSLRTDLVTVPSQSNVTAEGLIESADSSFTTTPTTGLSTIDSNATWTMSMGTAVSDDNPNSRNVTDGEHMTSLTNSTHISVTSSPATHTDPYHFNNSTDQQINPTHNLNTTKGSVANSLDTTLSYDNKVFRSTQDARNESMGGNPGATPTLGTVNTMTPIEDEDTAGVRSRLMMLLIIVPILVLIAVAGFLYRRKLIKERMDLPPPFKPPPPPVRYTAARHHDISTQPFPTSRCNSVTELKDMKQMNMYIY
ncbi:uncharacterized protein LOC144527724 isoform X2 [Sander vitreus]